MSKEIIKAIDHQVKVLKLRLKHLEKARAEVVAGEPVKEVKAKAKTRKPAKRQSARHVDKGLTDTIMHFLRQPEIMAVKVGLRATDIVELLGKRGHMFTSKFPSRSVSGLLTVLHKAGKVSRTPKGKPRTYHYKARDLKPLADPETRSVPAFGRGEVPPDGVEAANPGS